MWIYTGIFVAGMLLGAWPWYRERRSRRQWQEAARALTRQAALRWDETG